MMEPNRNAQVRDQAARIIQNVLRNSGKSGIALYLALGEVCPFDSRNDQVVWIEELHRAGVTGGAA